MLNDKWHLPITIDSVFRYIQIQRSGIAVNYRKDLFGSSGSGNTANEVTSTNFMIKSLMVYAWLDIITDV